MSALGSLAKMRLNYADRNRDALAKRILIGHSASSKMTGRVIAMLRTAP